MSPALLPFSPKGVNANGFYDPMEIQYQKGVVHLSEIGIKKVPRKYVLPFSERPQMSLKGKSSSHKGDHVKLQLPIIDVAELQGPRRSEVLKVLASACENYGFFQVVNHAVPIDAITNMMDAVKRFFALPMSEKERYMSSDLSKPVRYGTSFNQLKDRVFCWRDFLKLVCNPPEDVISDWPSSPVDFRKMAVTYAKETKLLFQSLADATLESLGLANTNARRTTDEDEYEYDETLNDIKNGGQLLVINYYPSCPEPDLTFGIPPHSDFGLFTLLLQDEVPGLQIKHQGKWFTIEPKPGSFVVNVGDQLEIFSNGRFKSVVHRVITNSEKSRISVASFHYFPFLSVVRPCKRLINETNPRNYKETDFASLVDYIKSTDYKEKNFLETLKLT